LRQGFDRSTGSCAEHVNPPSRPSSTTAPKHPGQATAEPAIPGQSCHQRQIHERAHQRCEDRSSPATWGRSVPDAASTGQEREGLAEQPAGGAEHGGEGEGANAGPFLPPLALDADEQADGSASRTSVGVEGQCWNSRGIVVSEPPVPG
jgi:hypothetical protein